MIVKHDSNLFKIFQVYVTKDDIKKMFGVEKNPFSAYVNSVY